ncbi:MAG: SDR family NAD(P)-dependent oxidoreductase [Prevotellaceae bacterium]|jgi:NADP-dependent 3-hydroxy acid dehydrogenase YdfG|nr:SDR family NAD(P)-dependent oxidoreductase [Prevotellaceae bacterium]
MKTALITGATSGIGEATAFTFAEKGFGLILTGRRTERLNRVAELLNSRYSAKIVTIAFDIRDRHETEKAVASIPEDFKPVDILVNNAGLALGLEHVQDGDADDWDRMIDTNIKGLLYVTRAVAPLMIAGGNGHIVNIGSIAGRETYENGGVYCATKHAVDALSKSMRMDMLENGIKVTNVCPGATETEFSEVRFKGDEKRAKKVYEGFKPLTAGDIAEIITYIVSLPRHVCVNDILIMPLAQANAVKFIRNAEYTV